MISQLNMVHKVALDLTTWHVTMPILALPPAEGGFGQAGLGAYAQWVHSQAFVQSVVRLASVSELHAAPFRRWTGGVGLVLDLVFLPYLQLAPVPRTKPSFLKGSLKCYSVAWRGGGVTAPPPPPLERPSEPAGVAFGAFSQLPVADVRVASAAEKRSVAVGGFGRWAENTRVLSGKIGANLLGSNVCGIDVLRGI